MEQTLAVTLDQRGGLTVLTLVGDIDHDTRPLLDGLLTRLPDPPGRIRVDMRGVPFMDSAGLHFLVELRRRQTTSGADVPTLVGVQEQPAGVLQLSGLDALLGIAA
ncbi:STAS domain-containing protein [Peterkaempfera bronchialis]|uniref:Anti-sigma factor antagonist n=1 Tax=Peterkaempfera bronchialis TaxID=2126346 RepID=A0A345SXA2_9ACTN|nr:STAS domain-containing protein [Peterkaempfera bronchialis]AXI78357.1 anti-sigma factor antagonist [Peterkaempfera bronchialis]